MINVPKYKGSKRRDAPQVLIPIHRNERIQKSASMPVIAVANVRSLLPKLNSFVEKIENEEIDITLVCEVWEKTGKKNRGFQAKVEEIMEMKGWKYISCGARPSGKRGGGAAILVNTSRFSLEKLDVHVPNNLEVQWGIVRQREMCPTSQFREYIVCSFYSAPNSRKHRKLLDHLVTTTHALMTRFPQAAVFLGGDRNSMPVAPLLAALPKFCQVVANNTHGEKILDVLVMSCPKLYAVPVVTPPVLPDNPRQAAPSDHRVPVARPLAGVQVPVVNVYKVKTSRPQPDSKVREFMRWIHEETWDSLPADGSPTEVVKEYERMLHEQVEALFPEKKVRITRKDKAWITAELKALDRKKMMEWRKKGKSDKYKNIQKEFSMKYKKASSDYIKKCVSDLKEQHPGRAAATLKKMGARPGDCEEVGSFTLLNHLKENLTVEEQIRRFSEYFISVSQEFPALEIEQLSDRTRQKLAEIRPEEIPVVKDYEIFQILDKAKKKKSGVPGDIPPRLFYEASAALATPAAHIMNRIAQSGSWPEQFQTEWGSPIGKCQNAEDESQARLLACTNKMNLVLEKQVIFWLMEIVRHKLDPDQFGGIRGNSISHYLIEMTNFILYNQDLKNPQATLGVFLDYKQGFNRCEHSKFIEILSEDFQVPGWLLRILIGYLRGRILKVRYKGKIGEEQKICGGSGQGVPLGLWIFAFMIDKAGPRAETRPLGEIITQPLKQRQRMDKTKKKWIDDFTLLTAVDLPRSLVPDKEPTRPVTYRSRFEQILPLEANPMQKELNHIVELTKERNMKLNPIKSKAMLFNTHVKYDVQPQVSTVQGEYLDVVEEHKILGQIVRSDLKSISNTEYICKKAYKRLWILRRLKALGCPEQELLEVLQQQIVSVCEFGLAWWGPMISKSESNMIKRCYKAGLHIILQSEYITFKQALIRTKRESLKVRRHKLLTSFGQKALKNEKHEKWFCKAEQKQDIG